MNFQPQLFKSALILITPSWISDGRWAVKKELFKNKEIIVDKEAIINLFSSEHEDVDDYHDIIEKNDEYILEALLPVPRKVKHLKKTDQVVTEGLTAVRIFQEENDGSLFLIGVDETYSNLLELENLYTEDIEKSLYNDKVDPTIIIMPVKLTGQ